MCELSYSQVNGFQSWYFPDKPYCCLFEVLKSSLKAFSHRRTYMYRRENGLKYAEFGYPVTKFISTAAQSSRDRHVEPGS